jgi:diguanylate cyclase (GGDEF)-like protein
VPPCELDRVARKWAYLVSMLSYIPLSHKEIERRLRDLAHEVFEAVAAVPPDVDRAAAVGEQLVKLHCVGRTSLRCSVDVLSAALLTDERLRSDSGLGERVARVLSALACGYADTVRWFTVEQQDGLNQALMEVVRKSEQSLRAREVERDEVATELSLLRSQLNHQLLHDVLTALPNRQFFTTRLEQVLNTGSPTSVYQLEINGLATIATGLGRQACVHLLRIVGDRLSGVVTGAHAMVARFESGRYGILVESTDPMSDPAPVVEAINAAFTEPVHVDGLAVVVSVSIGVVQSPPHHHDPMAVLHAADLALRKAKLMGPGRWTLLEPHRDDDRQELRLAATLPDAWWAGRVHVEFRPQVRLSDGLPARLDARLWWDHAELGVLPHERCVALAERVGFGERLGQWLLDHAGSRVRSWPGELPLTVAVPPSQLNCPELLAVLDRSGLPADRLQVSVPAGLATGASAVLTRLAGSGVAIAVHDFGGAAGDVTCLSDVPVHAVRLAPALVRRSAERVIGRALRDMVALGHEAGAVVVVDDVRTGSEADWWREAGADLVTGPLFRLPAKVTLP